MRYSRLLGKTMREDPHGVRTRSHALLQKGGFVRSMGQGLFSFLPLGMRVLKNIEQVIAEQMEALGGQEVYAPVITSAVLWRRSGRYPWIREEQILFKDRRGRELVISPTHEEAFVELVRSSLASYRDLPILLYQFQLKFRDEERTRQGLLRSREILMHDAYSFHRSYHDLNNFFPRIFRAYETVFGQCGVPVIAAEAGTGFIGGEKSYEFLMPHEEAGHAFMRCRKCSYCASSEIAVSGKRYLTEEPAPAQKVATPGCITMEQLAGRLEVPRQRLAKSVVYATGAGLVMAVVRADYEVSQEKLAAYLGVPVHRLAANEELQALGLVPGYLSPVDLDAGIRVVVDDSVARSANLVFGANREDYHVLNGNFGRDFASADVTDIALAGSDGICLQCGGRLEQVAAVEVGHIFKLGDIYTRSMGLLYQREGGSAAYPHMGCYGVGLGRLLDAVVRANHDEQGILWPARLAPFAVFLMGIGSSLAVRRQVEALHDQLAEIALYDDREESPGVKFKDADLLGLPLRVVASTKQAAEGKVEVRERRTGRMTLVEADKAAGKIAAMAGGLL